jgi:hypothetical protein
VIVKKQIVVPVHKTVPMQIVLVIDCSGSMRDKAEDGDSKSKIQAMRESASQFIDRLPVNRWYQIDHSGISLLPFSDMTEETKKKQPDIGLAQPFTNNRTALKARIVRLEPLGGTLLYDAIHDGIATLEASRRPGKRAVVVLTDGKDEFPGSRYSPDEVVAYAKETGTPLHLLGLGREQEINEPVMRDMANRTNGSYNRAKNQAELFRQFEKLAEEFQKEVQTVDEVQTIDEIKTVDEIKIEYETRTEIVSAQEEEWFEVVYDSPRPINDGSPREVEIQLFRRSEEASNKQSGGYANRGVVIPELAPLLYLPLLGGLLGLLLLPYGLARLGILGGKK